MFREKTAKERVKLVELTTSEKKSIAAQLYNKPGHFHERFSHDWTEFDCKNISDQLRMEIIKFLVEKKLIDGNTPLENLHEITSSEKKAYDFAHGVNAISSEFYNASPAIMSTYHQFVRFIRESVIKEPFWFQATPTIRVHCPEALNADLYPRYHTDICYGHPPEEINIWLPLTQTLNGHGFSILSIANSKKVIEQFNYDYDEFIKNATHDREFSNYCDSLSVPVDTEFGKVFVFDPRCVHSGQPLKEHTRISMDIRVLPISLYNNMEIEYSGSGRLKMLFMPGHGYHEKNSDECFFA